ncbi:P-loop containing nucleoside triphosphate hydrolase protein [Rhizoclosmatium globosum]|uniref:p-loop containing nucleoside triphosphate hydrolase protein n=1 Tax=Rhizoclosmatium globosum TaxID=329046 RepID=A0A1Y2CU04_9FUNG|nr:P-loop containing nucleoside triphosphate hydrolase protein [Rhizoclosmatium globosum]|eukprot:ORY50511.1 P-loop containing nucleoside triphosphate hydrolase protein [Rhizoclosmatium globosum]
MSAKVDKTDSSQHEWAEFPGAGPCPRDTANIFSRIVFQFINPLFKKGWKQPLTMMDLWDISDDIKANAMADKFEREWKHELSLWEKAQAGKPVEVDADGNQVKRVIDGSILRSCLWRLFKKEVFPMAIISLMSNMCNLLSPYMQEFIIRFVIKRDSPFAEPIGNGVGYALGLFALQIIGALFSTYFQQEMAIKSLGVKCMFSTKIYRKALRLSPAARQQFSSGQIINMATTDTARIQAFMSQTISIFTLPIILLINVVFLTVSIGWPALAGIGVLVLSFPLQKWLVGKMKVIRARQAPITDKRIKKTEEILTGIRIIKFFAWESSFFSVVEKIRNEELIQVLTRSVYTGLVFTQANALPALCTCVAFIAYGLEHPLDSSKVFSSMSWFNQLKNPIRMLPNLFTSYAEFNVAITRIESFLLSIELDDEGLEACANPNHAIEISDAEFSWTGPVFPADMAPPAPATPAKGKEAKKTDSKEDKSTKKTSTDSSTSNPTKALTQSDLAIVEEKKTVSSLKNINLNIPKGALTAIVGSVGGGKSSLLSAIIGEMRRVSGGVAVSGTIAYAAQTAWIQNATVKENILFGQPYEKERYLRALYDAALLPDLRILKDSDQTSIGEKGINLSGGQKQRINIARLLYNPASIVLLDDPLSAVDAHVGKHLFERCILGSLNDRTRVLVTHQLHFLPQCDYIVFVKDGTILEQGSFKELMASGGSFSEMMTTYGGHDENVKEGTPEIQDASDFEKVIAELDELTSPKENAVNIMSKEDQASGGVASDVWWNYLRACGGIWFCICTLGMVLLNEGTNVLTNLWLAWWTENSFPSLSNAGYSLIYLAIAVISSIITFIYAYYFAFTGTRASRIMHEKALSRVMRCPTVFFDTTPVGRIINRFTTDVDALDNTVAFYVRSLVGTVSTTLSTFIVMIVTLPILTAVLVPCMAIYWFVQNIYRKTAREIKRISSTARSPWFNNFGESLVGQQPFVHISNSPNYYLTTAGNWLSVRLQLIGSLLVLGAALLGITTSVLSAPLFGLCLTYSLTITQTLANVVENFTQCEIAMNSAERVEHYAHKVQVEDDNGQHKLPTNWPTEGSIEFKGVTMRYAPHLPVVLDDVSFKIRQKEKIGIVGRTGSGKSSLMQALFRMIQCEGLITIDGIDITSIGLHKLRSSLAVIPQDPFVFSGTFRFNLDPFGEHSDAELWESLERAGLKAKVAAQDGALDALVQAGGENLSVGERQLLCLARAMLKKPVVLIMDEATANVDFETDAKIQKSLREDFKEATVLTIAHRLNTIMDSDRVLILDGGKVAEFDSPRALLLNQDTIFYSLVLQTGESNAAALKSLVL